MRITAYHRSCQFDWRRRRHFSLRSEGLPTFRARSDMLLMPDCGRSFQRRFALSAARKLRGVWQDTEDKRGGPFLFYVCRRGRVMADQRFGPVPRGQIVLPCVYEGRLNPWRARSSFYAGWRVLRRVAGSSEQAVVGTLLVLIPVIKMCGISTCGDLCITLYINCSLRTIARRSRYIR